MANYRVGDQSAGRRNDAPFLALRLLTGGELNPTSGLFYSLNRRSKYYKATDNLHSEAYRGLLPEDLMDILTAHQLHYDQRTESGVLFHLIGAVSEFGKLGVTAIAPSAHPSSPRKEVVVDRSVLASGSRTFLNDVDTDEWLVIACAI